MTRQHTVRWDPERGWMVRRGPTQPEEQIPVAGDDDDPRVVRAAVEAHLGVSCHAWTQTAQPDGRIAYIGTEAGGLEKFGDWGMIAGGAGGVVAIALGLGVDMDLQARIYLIAGGAAGIGWAGYGVNRIRRRVAAKPTRAGTPGPGHPPHEPPSA